MRTAGADDVLPVQPFLLQALLRMVNGTGLDIKGVEDGIVRHETGQESRIMAIAAGHVDEDMGLAGVGFSHHM